MGKNADIIVTGGSFFCGKGLDNQVDFVAVKDGRVLALGKKDSMGEFQGPETKVYEYGKDTLVMPGFYDSHTHIISAGMAAKYPNFGKCATEEETAKAAFAYAKAHPDEEWIFGFNWYHVYWGQKELPTVKSLDKYIKDRPAMLTDAEGHGVWVNSKALEVCGITKDTKDPPHGHIERFENGEPSGYFDEMAIGLVAKKAYDFPEEIETQFILDYMDGAAKLGITAANDMLPYYGNDMGKPECFAKIAREGNAKVRIHSAPSLLGNLDEIGEIADRLCHPMYQVPLLKAFIDGVPTTYTSLMLEPFIDAPHTKGSTLCDLEELREAILNAHKRGMSIRIHCCGDGAVRYALACYEEAKNLYGDTGARHAIEHFETTTQEDIDLAARLSVIASMQPEHLAMTDAFSQNPYLIRYNERQKKFCWPIGSLLRAGAPVAFGSDCPVVTNNPFVGLYRAVTRVHNDGEPKGGWNPEQKITMEEALHAYTSMGYHGVKREGELGTMKEGKLADMIVLDQNLLSIAPEKIRDTTVLLTVVDGIVVYDKNA